MSVQPTEPSAPPLGDELLDFELPGFARAHGFLTLPAAPVTWDSRSVIT